MNMPTYSTSTAIQTSQFSSFFFVIIHCATRLVLERNESMNGNAASVAPRRKSPSAAEPARPMPARSAPSRGLVRVTCSSVRFSPPCSHSYQP